MSHSDRYQQILELWRDFIRREEFNALQVRLDSPWVLPLPQSALRGNTLKLSADKVKKLAGSVLRDYLAPANDPELSTRRDFPDDLYLLFPLLEYDDEGRATLLPIACLPVSEQLAQAVQSGCYDMVLDIEAPAAFHCAATVLSRVAAYEDMELDALVMDEGFAAFVASIADLRPLTAEEGGRLVSRELKRRVRGRYRQVPGLLLARLALADYSRKLQLDFAELAISEPPEADTIAHRYLFHAAANLAVDETLLRTHLWRGQFLPQVLSASQAQVLRRLAAGEALVAVEGPPGTGKTTLLLNVIASQVTNRALALAGGADYFAVPANLTLVVSDTNRAVENVTEQLAARFPGLSWLWLEGGSRARVRDALPRLDATLNWLRQECYDESAHHRARYQLLEYSLRLEKVRRHYDGLVVRSIAIGQELDQLGRTAERLELSHGRQLERLAAFDRDTTISIEPARLKTLRALIADLDPQAGRLAVGRALGELRTAYAAELAALGYPEPTRDQLARLLAVLDAVAARQAERSRLAAPAAATLAELEQLPAARERLLSEQEQVVAELRRMGDYYGRFHQYPAVAAEQARLFDAAVGFLAHEILLHKQEALATLLAYRKILAGTAGAREARRQFIKGMAANLRTLSLVYPVLATTLNSVRILLPFCEPDAVDLCLVDEAAMIPCHKLLPLLYRSRRAVVLGDPRQLPPVVSLTHSQRRAYSLTWRSNGFAGEEEARWSPALASAFHRACFAAPPEPPTYLTRLDEHRRSVADVAEVFVRLGEYEGLRLMTDAQRNELSPLGPLLAGSALLGYDLPGRAEGTANPDEAAAIRALLELLRRQGVTLQRDVAVLTPFRAQERLLADLLVFGPRPLLAHRQVGTIHRFQGQEFPIVILSPVLCRDGQPGLAFVNARPNLLTVAVSRARSLFVLVGNHAFLAAQGGALAQLTEEVAARGPVFPVVAPAPGDPATVDPAALAGIENLFAWSWLVAAVTTELLVATPRLAGQFAQEALDAIRVLQKRGVKVHVCLTTPAGEGERYGNDPILVEQYRHLLGNRFLVAPTGASLAVVDGSLMLAGSWPWLAPGDPYYNAWMALAPLFPVPLGPLTDYLATVRTGLVGSEAIAASLAPLALDPAPPTSRLLTDRRAICAALARLPALAATDNSAFSACQVEARSPTDPPAASP